MAKRRKAASKTPVRRTSRRGKPAEDVATPADGEVAAASVEPTPTEAPSNQASSSDPPPSTSDGTSDQHSTEGPSTKLNVTPRVVLHKKFGKYRCLFNNDETFSKKYEVGSDSETNSSLEIRVVDPCASSESDSNAAIDTQSDTNSGACPSPMNSTINLQSNSRDISPTPVVNEQVLPGETSTTIPLTKEDNHVMKSKGTYSGETSTLDITQKVISQLSSLEDAHVDLRENDSSNIETNCDQISQMSIQEDQQLATEEDQVEYNVDDDEVITIVQIVEEEDDNPELYYNIQIDSPKEGAETETSNNTVNDNASKAQEADFQQHFEKLNLTHVQPNSPMDCSDVAYLDFAKDSTSNSLMRPDPSLTPSSTLSDDSNSSRVTEQAQINSNDSAESSPTGVRRSSRIKTISNLKQKTKGYGLVKTPLKKALITQTKIKLEELGSDSQEKSLDQVVNTAPNSPSFPVPSDMPVKVKSRWRRSSELEMSTGSPVNSPLASPKPSVPRLPPVLETQSAPEVKEETPISKKLYESIIQERMNQFQHLDENEYMCDRMVSKETKKMICDCFLTKEELERGELACGEDCLNRLLMIECNSRCPVGDRCTNRRFQKRENAALKVFYADKKGCGVEASADITSGEFLMEYVGEVLDYEQFYKRAQAYSDENNLHHYFMSLKGDTVIDATLKGNISRFINHSCDPNAETQKWTVNGELRIGFFSKREIVAGEELTFDYQFQRFGKVAQRCYCGAHNCRGWIGGEPDSDDDDYEEEEEDITTSKTSEASQETQPQEETPRRPKRRPKKDKYKPAPDLVQDADIEEELEALSRTGVKNQSHTLRLSRTVVRAKSRRCQLALLRLVRDADLPCRRLFLSYRGLRLLAPWCADASPAFRLEMLQTVDRLPIPNKTMVQESKFFTIVERWLSAADAPVDNVFIDETTGLPVDLPGRNGEQESSPEKAKEAAAIMEKIKDLSQQLLERWSNLKEVFKIPKKERIQQMKEHERQANVERRAADSSGSRDRDRDRRDDRERERERRDDRERDRERRDDRDRDRERDRDSYRDRDRDRHRERERDDRDRRKRRSSPDGRRSIRLHERVLAPVPPLSKEERRRAFAEAAAAADESRRQREQAWPYWGHEYAQNLQMYGGGMMPPGASNMMGQMMMGPDWRPDMQYCPPFPQPYCLPQANMMGMSGFGMNMFPFGQQMPAPFPAGSMPQAQPDAMPMVQAEGSSDPVEPEEVVLPSMWRSAVDERGRTYYYHVKLRQAQWGPPDPPHDAEESSSEEEEEQEPQMGMPVSQHKFVEGVNGIYEVLKKETSGNNGLIPEHALITPKPRKRRPGLVSERPISPRTEEDKLAGRMEVKRYKQTKERLRRRRERLVSRVRQLAARRPGMPTHVKLDLADSETESDEDSEDEKVPSPSPEEPEAPDAEETARKIKEQFRSSMARIMVHHLNPYRHPEAPAGRITSTGDFKHLARKLTHFVMLKELKHCRAVEELVVTDSVRTKAKTFVRKYMAKFGPVYRRPAEEAD